MLIYGLKNCDTCRKAIKALPDAQLVDVRKSAQHWSTPVRPRGAVWTTRNAVPIRWNCSRSIPP